jgi:hypothetical protein
MSTIRNTYINANAADTRGERMSTIRHTCINTNTADTRGGEQMSTIRNTYINALPKVQLTLVVANKCRSFVTLICTVLSRVFRALRNAKVCTQHDMSYCE